MSDAAPVLVVLLCVQTVVAFVVGLVLLHQRNAARLEASDYKATAVFWMRRAVVRPTPKVRVEVLRQFNPPVVIFSQVRAGGQ